MPSEQDWEARRKEDELREAQRPWLGLKPPYRDVMAASQPQPPQDVRAPGERFATFAPEPRAVVRPDASPALSALTTAELIASPAPADDAAALIDGIIRDVAELPDRTSPDDAPDMMLVSADELRAVLSARLAEMAGLLRAYGTRGEIINRLTTERDAAVARADAAEAALAEARAELAARTAALEDERAIVNRIWKQLGSPSYEQLGGRSIYDLIDGLKDAAAGMSADVTRLTADRDRLAEAARELDEAVGNSLDRDFAFWSSSPSRASVYPAWRDLRAALASLPEPEKEAGR